jgi:hypothetical protein
MRHLRLKGESQTGKTQKEKVEQGKFWDFTVRGWRVANVTGIDDFFEKKETALNPQKEIATLKYEDIKIDAECNCMYI